LDHAFCSPLRDWILGNVFLSQGLVLRTRSWRCLGPERRTEGKKQYERQFLKVIGVALVVSSTFQMASEAEHQGRRDPLRRSNSETATLTLLRQTISQLGHTSDRGEAAISGAIAGH
jgi:hypothetical protein